MITTLLALYIATLLNPFSGIQDPLNTDSTLLASTNYLPVTAIPTQKKENVAPIIDAEAAIAVDTRTGTILFEQEINKPLQIASITKLMTALVILEENSLNEVVIVSSNAAQTSGSRIWLYEGEKILVRDLLYAILIHSANDAATALAEHNAGTVEDFVNKMNLKAKKLGLKNTHFTNPVGFDDPENHSTAYELSILGRYAYSNNFVRHAASIKKMEISSAKGNITHKLESTNNLLDSYLNIKGLKTGHTEAAGLCLVAIAEGGSGNEIITIVLNSPARFKETKLLVDWVFRAYIW